jgi:HD-GYP domain-containing protein (c-di-GMP phosphodiesterase class II)
VPYIPIFPQPLEAKVMETLNTVLLLRHMDPRPIEAHEAQPLIVRLTRLVDCVFPMDGTHSEFSGPDSQQGSDYVHPIKVAELAIVIGREMGMPRSQLIALATASALMNCGYLALKRSVMDEPTVLMEGAWEQHMHAHPDETVTMAARAGLSDDVIAAMREHHERWDGSGFPRGLRSTGISPMARVVGVADAYISLRSFRAGHTITSAADALAAIKASRGVLLDPSIVDVFETVVAKYPDVPPVSSRLGERLAAMGIEPDDPLPQSARGPAPEVRDEGRFVRPDAGEPDHDEAAQRHAAESPRIAPRAPAAAPPAQPAPPVRPPLAPAARIAAAPVASAAQPQERVLTGVPRRRMRRPTLFSTSLYVDAAAGGEWRPRGQL